MLVDGPAEPAIANHGIDNAPPDQGRRDAAAGSLYFRKFGHG
jgi:hypothetical protein